MKKRCTNCGAEVELPKKVEGKGPYEIKCPNCGAKALLMVNRRNHRVQGINGCFLEKKFWR
ncbi:MAG TPA: hypothetical protein PLL80_00805 [Candidatus Pacearchaeota archaeon]|nr:hypothetical protein [Candidatus Pacearchaeota archaeon]HOK94067.1 hypothetical protein [Candidatus Pacearchaeota archaeon]HPO75138.1 hypothetical protein [Candidatus Pacearchaeota archaeon]